MVLVPVHTYTVDLLLGGQAGQAWHGIISGQTSMALALGWHSWHWCWDSLTDGLMALGMCQNSLQWCCDSLHDGLMALAMCQNIWHRCWVCFHGIGVVLEHITMVLGQLPQHWCCAGTHYNGAGMAFMMAPWHWGCARMACMMDLWHWGYARIHGTGAGLASMALVWCWYTLQWCQNGLHNRPHGIGDVPEYMA
ncbi:hypothetical protein F5J12DRAFT_785515 [Pisolithus orientalis]|uniref:uncharacterized protein n=1 Tax=Pisolithus orientalis TaxID=936130 RepID=UPI002225A36A|nr:uncharacterized protein F5J12DRAFT_785515 [Pisolithus orientalis]KAI5996031.1 hypothetical protein F5J12DRAFT_785515 [Pisolithus orientalis]